jgi:2-dehydro-3-deoxy-D-arabinonate dehydratase
MRVVRVRRDGSVRFALEVEPGAFDEIEAETVLDALAGNGRFRDRLRTNDRDILSFGPDVELLAPLDPPEVWCAGVTYARSRDARVDEAVVKDVYTMVYEASRPELFLKDAGGRRTVGPGGRIGIREDATWNVPEAEIGLVLGAGGAIAGYTIGNDVSSRDIEGANPLYLPQAKVYAGACALGPAVLAAGATEDVFTLALRIADAEGETVFEGSASTASMVRSYRDLVSWLLRDNPVPPGSVLLTGTGIVPPDEVTLLPGQHVEIHVPGIGTLVNTVALAREV